MKITQSNIATAWSGEVDGTLEKSNVVFPWGETRRESGEDKRAFAKEIKQDWLGLNPTSKVSNVAARLASS